jgi:hypothetical protein
LFRDFQVKIFHGLYESVTFGKILSGYNVIQRSQVLIN